MESENRVTLLPTMTNHSVVLFRTAMIFIDCGRISSRQQTKGGTGPPFVSPSDGVESVVKSLDELRHRGDFRVGHPLHHALHHAGGVVAAGA